MREKADREGVDLLLIDSGDRIEGNGLYDASNPKGKYDLNIFLEQNVDVICSGNHELYKTASVEYEHNTTVPHYKDNYIASNLDFKDAKKEEQSPLAQRFKKFTTKNQGIRIIAFGFLFDFTDNAENIVVRKVDDAIKEKWFQDAIRDREVDLFLVVGHISLHSLEFEAIYKAIRSQQWDIPIQFFGGHSHIRDYAKFDKKAYALESGRYLETVGFMSIKGLNTGGKKRVTSFESPHPRSKGRIEQIASPTFSRRYIDNNLYSFYHHTSLNETTFPTDHGREVSAMISSARNHLNLDQTYGCAPQNFWTSRAPFPQNDSVFTLLQEHILPSKVKDDSRKGVPRIVLTNTGAIRFDIFKGRFTVDSMYTVSPFTSGFHFVKDVPFSIAKRLLQILNHGVPQLWPLELATQLRAKVPASVNMHVSTASPDAGDFFSHGRQIPLTSKNEDNLTPGYTTKDDDGSDGDDTIHTPIKFYQVPNCIESRVDFPSPSSGDQEPANVDVVYNSFLEKYVLHALKFLGTDYNQDSTAPYMNGKSMTEVIGEWVTENWPCDEKEIEATDTDAENKDGLGL